jgi:hypothetical protein
MIPGYNACHNNPAINNSMKLTSIFTASGSVAIHQLWYKNRVELTASIVCTITHDFEIGAFANNSSTPPPPPQKNNNNNNNNNNHNVVTSIRGSRPTMENTSSASFLMTFALGS